MYRLHMARATLLALVLAGATLAATAAEMQGSTKGMPAASMPMQQDGMTKEGMAKDDMTKDDMTKDGMTKDGMTKDGMSGTMAKDKM